MHVLGIESNGNVKGCLSLPSQRHGHQGYVEGNVRNDRRQFGNDYGDVCSATSTPFAFLLPWLLVKTMSGSPHEVGGWGGPQTERP